MCYSKAEGGQRCATHTLAALTRARAALSSTPDDPQVQQTYRTALVDYAATPEGRNRLHAARLHAVDEGDTATADQLRDVLAAGRERELAAAEAHQLARDLAERVAELEAKRANVGDRLDSEKLTGSALATRERAIAALEYKDARIRCDRAQAAFDATEPGQDLIARELQAARRDGKDATVAALEDRQRAARAFRLHRDRLRAYAATPPPPGTPPVAASTDFGLLPIWASVPGDDPAVDRAECWRHLERQARARDAELVARGRLSETQEAQRASRRFSLRQGLLDREGNGEIDRSHPRLHHDRLGEPSPEPATLANVS